MSMLVENSTPMRLAGLLLLLATMASAADLRDVKEPAKIKAVFPAAAKIRIVNIWATWCVPCVGEIPELRAVDKAFGPEIALAGVSMDDMIPESTRQKVVTFLDKQKISYTNLYYSGNLDDLTDYFRFEGEIPVTIAFDRSGKEVWRHQGPIKSADTIAELRKLLGRMQ
jgi:thiol-disulfide isomerase/thioredoxin